MCAAVLDLQCVKCAFNTDFIFITGLDLNAILDPLCSPYILMGQFKAERGFLSLDYIQVLQGLLDFDSCGEKHQEAR